MVVTSLIQERMDSCLHLEIAQTPGLPTCVFTGRYYNPLVINLFWNEQIGFSSLGSHTLSFPIIPGRCVQRLPDEVCSSSA
jgi:hypothetical protein